jgi:signal transduction histidine kinase/CheY-like chemotaxis protein/purine-cytosine permease-like protein
MTAPQRIVRVRRNYNQWVANQTLEDYALRFTAKSARKWSTFRVANAALGAISFLALEAIGGAITINYGFTNAVTAILVVGVIIFFTGLPIAYYAAKYGIDIDLLTRGAGFGYIGSTVTSLIYASFTFLFFAIEAAIMSLALELCFGVPLALGYIVSSVVVIPLVTHGITFISRLQLWTQPIWIVLHLLPFGFIAMKASDSFEEWTHFSGSHGEAGQSFNLVLFGAASTVVFSLIAQIGEQVDFLRFLPRPHSRSAGWRAGFLAAGPGWIVPGALKLLVGSFLAVLAVHHLVPLDKASEPTQMYLVAFRFVFSSPELALAFTGTFVILSQIKINVTNAYAGSIAWSNFFSRLTHSHPGRVVWLVFNVAIALVLMELGIFKALEHILGLYSIVAIAWVGALVADLVINKPLGFSPPAIEFKRAHLYDVNPVGVGAMAAAGIAGIASYAGYFGDMAQAFSSFVTLGVAFVCAPAIAIATRGRFYIARGPHKSWQGKTTIRCCICEHKFEPEDMALCPAYSGPICSLCCSLDARCHDRCKPGARLGDQIVRTLGSTLPAWIMTPLTSRVGHYLGVQLLFMLVFGAALSLVHLQARFGIQGGSDVLRDTLWMVFFILSLIAGVAAWLFVLAQESRHVAEEESMRQTNLLMREIEAHKRTDSMLQKAKEVAEAASKAKSRYVVGLSHELRTPLNAILGYAQLLERDGSIPPRRIDAIKVVRRSAEHLSGLIDGLLDVSKIEAGRFQLNRDEVRLPEFLEQLVDMFQLQAKAKGLAFQYVPAARTPVAVYTDASRLRQVLINLLSNAIKFTEAGHVALRVTYRNQVATFEIEDTGIGIRKKDLGRIFEPFERAHPPAASASKGIGLGLTITRLLAETMGGEIVVTSTFGQGSVFRVKLLLSEVAQPRPTVPVEKRISGYRGPRITALVADDDEIHRNLIHEILAPLGFTVLDAADGAASMRIAQQCRPEVILLDIFMPGMSGWDVARKLRAKGYDKTAIIMLSANISEAHRALTPERAHDDYLIKPIDVRQLLDKIQALLKIEWTYEAEPDRAVEPVERPLSAISIPGRLHIDDLLHLGQIGYVRGIQAKLAEIESEAERHEPFVTQMRGLVATYDLKRFMAVLTELQGHDAH